MGRRPDETHAPLRDLLFTVTEFFRDPEVFGYFEAVLLPAIFERKIRLRHRVRVWSIGCSTGEEAYSIAVMLLDQAARVSPGAHPQLQIFATELHDEALVKARDGVYLAEIAAAVSPERLERFFVAEGGQLVIRREVREVVTFAAHNLFKDPPYSRLDMIVCRNLLRDLQPEIRHAVLKLFHYALEPHGFLIVGAEDEIDEDDLFSCAHAATGVYRRARAQDFGTRASTSAEADLAAVLEELEASNEERKRTEAMLRDADRRKDEFLALLAHELRNPLAPISAGVEVLQGTAHDPKLVEQVTQTIARQTRQLVRLVDDLLEISRLTGGRLHQQRAHVQASEVIRDAVAAVRPLIEDEKHSLTVTVPDEPLTLHADPARITQVIANLLTNAARYTPHGGKLAIVAARDESDVVIRVLDNGIGIAPENLQRVFDMFYQSDDPHVTHSAGLGIGLTLAKSLVEMHGGTISVASSDTNGGSEFTVRLPLVQEPEASESKLRQDAEKLGGHRVLIVDDNVDAAEMLGMLVRGLGENDVHTARSGADALAIAASFHPDIVLLDLKMAGMDGYEVAQRLRREPWGKNALVVALTGWAQEEHRQRAKEAGFDRHLSKPANRSALEAVLRERPDPHA